VKSRSRLSEPTVKMKKRIKANRKAKEEERQNNND